MGQADQFVSVVMPVRDALPFLDAAIESILAQTHEKFELVIGDDSSADGSGERLDYWARRDRRIRLLRHHGCGQGPAGSSNWVTCAARYDLIARMDADDISMPDRLRMQVEALSADPGATIVGGLSDQIDAEGRQIAGRNRSIFRDPHCIFPCSHGSLMFRREVFERASGYRRECDYWEDVDLFVRMKRNARVLILPDVVYRYRFSPTSSRQVSNEARVTRALELSARCLSAYAQGHDYEPLIEESLRSPPVEKISLSVLVLVAQEKLWRGHPRATFKSWAWRHISFSRWRHRIRILIFLAWLWLSPGSLRSMFKLRARLADWRARHLVTDGTPYVWHDAAAMETRPPAHGQAPVIAFQQHSTAAEPRTPAGGRLVATAGATRFHGPA
jgi:glycosyltransferase involved in cell wall biosynthesis